MEGGEGTAPAPCLSIPSASPPPLSSLPPLSFLQHQYHLPRASSPSLSRSVFLPGCCFARCGATLRPHRGGRKESRGPTGGPAEPERRTFKKKSEEEEGRGRKKEERTASPRSRSRRRRRVPPSISASVKKSREEQQQEDRGDLGAEKTTNDAEPEASPPTPWTRDNSPFVAAARRHDEGPHGGTAKRKLPSSSSSVSSSLSASIMFAHPPPAASGGAGGEGGGGLWLCGASCCEYRARGRTVTVGVSACSVRVREWRSRLRPDTFPLFYFCCFWGFCGANIKGRRRAPPVHDGKTASTRAHPRAFRARVPV